MQSYCFKVGPKSNESFSYETNKTKQNKIENHIETQKRRECEEGGRD